MCGIVGYFGNKDSVPILINGLKRLEYRGYDSAGLAVMGDDQIHFLKKAGKVSVLEREVDDHVLHGSIGMAHTRWATHGEPNDINAWTRKAILLLSIMVLLRITMHSNRYWKKRVLHFRVKRILKSWSS